PRSVHFLRHQTLMKVAGTASSLLGCVRFMRTCFRNTQIRGHGTRSAPSPVGAIHMRMKVYEGTPLQSGQSLCETCRHSTITRGRRIDEEIVRCEALPMASIHITFPVTTCTAYLDAELPSYMELLEKAWILKPRDGKRSAGFMRASDLTVEERYTLI